MDLFKKIEISDSEYNRVCTFLFDHTGMMLKGDKRSLIVARLQKVMRKDGVDNISEYINLVEQDKEGLLGQVVINALTTNETRFFREKVHFDFLKSQLRNLTISNRNLRVWSAACSTGEEPYSIAMLLAESLAPDAWSVVASDINDDALSIAKRALYPIKAASLIDSDYLNSFCLKGFGPEEGNFTIKEGLKNKIDFKKINLNVDLDNNGVFDVIFLRNVLIYFDSNKTNEIVHRITRTLRKGGFLFIGHSETLQKGNGLVCVKPTVYQKVE